jgi:two-component system sensor histidine kinase BaeS
MGLTARTALALAATAILAVGLSAFVVSRGLGQRAREAAEQRLRGAAVHAATYAGDEYAETGRWNRAVALEVSRAAAISGYRAILFDREGRVVTSGRPAPAGRAAAEAGAVVRSGGRSVGSVRLEVTKAQLEAEERDLTRRIMGLALLAAVLAAGGALLAVPLLASTLVRPIRRLHDAVDRLRDGTRVPEAGPREIADLARRFNALSEGLAQEERARRAMAADVAHELRTPLNGLLLRIEAAQDEVLEDQQRNLQAMHTEARRLGALIEDVEALAEAERPGVLMERERVDMAQAARERLTVHAAAFRDAGIDLREQLADGAIVDGDAARLAQILDNLLTNALRYTDRGGTVTITVRRHGDGVTVDVSDTGIGIAADDLSHVFDRFWRADRSRSRATGGSGVGLAVVQRLVVAHGGRIEVESEPGRGTSFHIWLPSAGVVRA